MLDIYGYSFKNGIVLRTNTITVTAKRDENNEIKLDVSKQNVVNNIKTSKFMNIIYYIPFIRGIFNSIIINSNKLLNGSLIMFLLFDIASFYVGKSNNNSLINQFNIISTIFLISISGLMIHMNKNIKTIKKYHGAEHKIINTYDENKEITIENVKKSNRVNIQCGTVSVIFLLLSYIIAFLFISKYGSICVLISFALSFELYAYGYKIPIIKYFYKLGLLLQKYLTTAEPDKEQIEVGIACINKLLEESEIYK